MAKQRTVLNVFVASPSDVAEERAILEEVVRELNVTWSESLGIQLDLWKWETHATPGVGVDAQDVINNQVGDDYDLFVGIMWARFGTPTTRAGSGTEEEFLRAIERHDASPGSLEIFFYFKDQPVSPSQMDPVQLAQVQQFQRESGAKGVFSSTFADIDEFRSTLRIHLSRFVQQWHQNTPGSELARVPPSSTDDLDEPGLIDQIELALDEVNRNKEIIGRMTEAVQVLGTKFESRMAEARGIADTDMKALKRISNAAAADLNDFTARVQAELPLFSGSLSTAINAFGESAAIAAEIDPDSVDGLRPVLDSVRAYRDAIQSSSDEVVAFREVVYGMPRTTTLFNRSRRSAVSVLDDMLQRFDAACRQFSDVVLLIEDLMDVPR